MKLNFTAMKNSQNFAGVRPPYSKNGYIIKPIAIDPTKEDIETALTERFIRIRIWDKI